MRKEVIINDEDTFQQSDSIPRIMQCVKNNRQLRNCIMKQRQQNNYHKISTNKMKCRQSVQKVQESFQQANITYGKFQQSIQKYQQGKKKLKMLKKFLETDEHPKLLTPQLTRYKSQGNQQTSKHRQAVNKQSNYYEEFCDKNMINNSKSCIKTKRKDSKSRKNTHRKKQTENKVSTQSNYPIFSSSMQFNDIYMESRKKRAQKIQLLKIKPKQSYKKIHKSPVMNTQRLSLKLQCQRVTKCSCFQNIQNINKQQKIRDKFRLHDLLIGQKQFRKSELHNIRNSQQNNGSVNFRNSQLKKLLADKKVKNTDKKLKCNFVPNLFQYKIDINLH